MRAEIDTSTMQNKPIGVVQSEGLVVYELEELPRSRGRSVVRNRWSALIQRGPNMSDLEAERLARRIVELLNQDRQHDDE